MLNVRYWCCVVCGRRLAENVLLADAGHAEASCWGCGVVNVLPLERVKVDGDGVTSLRADNPVLIVGLDAETDAPPKRDKARESVVKG